MAYTPSATGSQPFRVIPRSRLVHRAQRGHALALAAGWKPRHQIHLHLKAGQRTLTAPIMVRSRYPEIALHHARANQSG